MKRPVHGRSHNAILRFYHFNVNPFHLPAIHYARWLNHLRLEEDELVARIAAGLRKAGLALNDS